MSKVSKKILESTKGVVNIHPGILPFYRGANCVEWAILKDDIIGNTSHFMDKNYDSGPIIIKSKINHKSCYSYEDLRVKVYKDGINLCLKTFEKLKKKKFKKELDFQNENKSNFFKLMSKKNLKKVKNKVKTNFQCRKKKVYEK